MSGPFMSSIRLVVLAAGKGTRMKSAWPKVLHRLAGRPLLLHVLDTGAMLEPVGMSVVVGHGARAVRDTVAAEFDAGVPIDWVSQTEQLGTGHAVREALPTIADADTVLITYGDVPLIGVDTCRRLLAVCDATTLGLLTLVMSDPTGYGRILRRDGEIVGVVEQKDASAEQLALSEANAGVIAVRGATLKALLARIDDDNAQNEYYLTDIIGLAAGDGLRVQAVHPGSAHEVDGVNSRRQLARLERLHQLDIANALMDGGVTLADPARLDVRGTLLTGTDCLIDVNCVFEGDCRLGDNVSIGPNCVIRDSVIASGTLLHAHCNLDGARVDEDCLIGPYARLRPGTELQAGARVGNFVETKNARVGAGSKISHLSYVGDAVLGRDVNVGAGTITCNYDGVNKHRTDIGDGVFVGSNSVLVAPVSLGAGVFVGAGSTITRDADADTLVLGRARQKQLDGWVRPVSKRTP